MRATYLLDTSALSRLPVPAVASIVEPLIQSGTVGMCGMIELELLYAARNHSVARQLLEDIRIRFERVPTLQDDFERAAFVMLELSRRGEHRSVSLPDLVIAAVAERAGLNILHYDQDFDHIAAITGQQTSWVARRGSID